MTHEDISKTMRKNGFRRQVKRRRRTTGSLDLQDKVADAGGEGGFGLEVNSSDEENQAPNNNKSDQNDGVYGSRKSAAASVNTMRRTRLFDKKPPSSRAASAKGKSFQASVASSKNPYARLKRSSGLSSSRAGSTVRSRVNPRLPTAAVHIVCAIGENLARETCIASLDAGTPVSLQVTKQGNGQTYAETLAYLEMLRPDEVLLNEGRRNSQLARKVLQLYGGRWPLPQDARSKNDSQKEDASAAGPCESSTVVKFIPRSCFDQTKGAELLRRVARAETYDASVVEEYILLSSAHAVLHYTQQSLGATFSRNCLDLTINSGGNNRMAIDRSTLLQLELLTNAKTGKTRNSLIATIDCTKTTVGTRLLRTNLMAPPCRIDTINARLDLVDTFLADEEFFYTVLEQLQNLPDVDKMLTNVAIVPRKARSKQTGAGEAPVVTERMASKGISALVCIKSTLTALPSFAMALHDQLSQIELEEGNTNATDTDAASAITDKSSLLIGLGGGPPSTKAPRRHHLLRAIIHAMRQPGLLEIVEAVSEIFTESTSFSRNANAMRHQECFALKSADGMMDILRKAFLANVDDIYKKADEYAETHGIHVAVRYSSSRGYYLSVPGETASTLPQEFIQPAKSGNCIHCTTEEVQSLNTRAQDNVQDLLLMTYEKIREVLDVARSKYDTLASLSDAVALLDLCHSFADNVTLSKLPWCRPVVSGEPGESLQSQNSDIDDSGKIAIHNGRYGIDLTDAGITSADGPGEVIPNDTFATNAKNFTVISGINGSGKSTYLKQVAIIVLLAHCGSYVPAEQASIPVSLDWIVFRFLYAPIISRSQLVDTFCRFVPDFALELVPLMTKVSDNGLAHVLCYSCANFSKQSSTLPPSPENNISSFMLEMKETAFICNNASTKSLILLDELGRATSNEDGVAIAWAVSEYLLSKNSMTFFVTHYPQLCRLSNVYPSVQNQHLQAAVSRDENGGISYTHKVSPGPCNVDSDYGVEMASSCGWPVDVLHNVSLSYSAGRSSRPVLIQLFLFAGPTDRVGGAQKAPRERILRGPLYTAFDTPDAAGSQECC